MDFSDFLSKKIMLTKNVEVEKERIMEELENNVFFEWISNEDLLEITIMNFNMKIYNENISMKIQKEKNNKENLELIFFSTLPSPMITIQIEEMKISLTVFIEYIYSKLIEKVDHLCLQILDMEEYKAKDYGYQKDTIGGKIFSKIDSEIQLKQKEIIAKMMEIEYVKTKDLDNSVIEHQIKMYIKERSIQIFVCKEMNHIIVKTLTGKNIYDNNLQKMIENILDKEDILQTKEILLSFHPSKKNVLKELLYEKVLIEYKKTKHYKLNNLY
jgi:hypothetical protein